MSGMTDSPAIATPMDAAEVQGIGMTLTSTGGEPVIAPAGGRAASQARSAREAALAGIGLAALVAGRLALGSQIPRLASPDSTYTAFSSAGSGGVLVTVG